MEPTTQDRLCFQDAEEFAKPVLKTLRPMARRIAWTLLLGVVASGSTMLSRIARAVWPRKPIRTAINLLSRYLVNTRVPMEKIREAHLKQQAQKVVRDAWVYIDPSDAAKPYARVLEHLAYVRDASLDRIVKGYWTLHAVASNGPGSVVGLMTEIFSVENPETPSFPGFVLSRVERLDEALQRNEVFVLDQGLSSDDMIGELHRRERKFVARITAARRVLDEKGMELGILDDLGPSVPYGHRVRTLNTDQTRRREWDLFWCTVQLPGIAGPVFRLVCVRWLHEAELHYFFLLTNLEVRAPWQAERVLLGYLGRQLVEDYIRFVKQQVQMEGFLVQPFERISRIVWVAGWAANFLLEQDGMGLRRRTYFIREVKALVKPWKELWTLAAWGFALSLRRMLHVRSPRTVSCPSAGT